MKLESKYNLNQHVYTIAQKMDKKWIVCASCEGDKNAFIGRDGKPQNCLACHGDGGHYENIALKWYVKRELTIGKVTVQAVNIVPDDMFDNMGHYKEGKTKYEVSYMAYETGVGCGTVYYEDALFATAQEAQAECDMRNKKAPEA